MTRSRSTSNSFSAHARLERVDVLHRWCRVSLDLIETSQCDEARINLTRLEDWVWQD